MADINKKTLIGIIEALNFKRDKPSDENNYIRKDGAKTLEITITINLDLIVYISMPVAGSTTLRNQQKIEFAYLSELEPFLITSVIKNDIDNLNRSIVEGVKKISNAPVKKTKVKKKK